MNYFFFKEEMVFFEKYSINIKNGEFYTDDQMSIFWKEIVKSYKSINPLYKHDIKIGKFAANHISTMVSPEFSDNHPIIRD